MVHDGAHQETPPRIFEDWLAAASDTELARALAEPEAYVPAARERLQEEGRRRGLDVERLLAEARRREMSAHARRGWVGAGFVLVAMLALPGLWPTEERTRVTLWLDNPGASPRRVDIGPRVFTLAAGESRFLALPLVWRERPLLALLRRLTGLGRPTRSLSVEAEGRVEVLHVRPASRWLVPLGEKGAVYEVRGPSGKALRRLEITQPLDLDAVPTLGGRRRVGFETEFVPASWARLHRVRPSPR